MIANTAPPPHTHTLISLTDFPSPTARGTTSHPTSGHNFHFRRRSAVIFLLASSSVKTECLVSVNSINSDVKLRSSSRFRKRVWEERILESQSLFYMTCSALRSRKETLFRPFFFFFFLQFCSISFCSVSYLHWLSQGHSTGE